jgi:hypothetical protein
MPDFQIDRTTLEMSRPELKILTVIEIQSEESENNKAVNTTGVRLPRNDAITRILKSKFPQVGHVIMVGHPNVVYSNN